ncbi:MAG: U32 family peptidase [Candidatus Omnitrophica bacterium]|nr:U32 family peptidase [Candidatus Omnitrophota bacterium]
MPCGKRQRPELIAPAGDWACLTTAVAQGADSVYFGVKGLSLRNFAGNFDSQELRRVMEYVHARGKRGYLALNVVVYERELTKVRAILGQAKKAGVDAVICWDLSVVRMAGEQGLQVHLSTQASAANSRALAEYTQLGISRAVLARECTLKDVISIQKSLLRENIVCELEVFIHGAMCISISGRCFLSAYSAGKSANRGQCLQYCRRRFLIREVQDEQEYELGEDYVLSARDLCTLDFLDELLDSGVRACKIEGRTRPPEYVGAVTSVYRRAIDDWHSGTLTGAKKKRYRQELAQTYNRGFSPGFYFGTPAADPSDGGAQPYRKQYIGRVEKYYARLGVAEISVHKGPLRIGQELLVTGKQTPAARFSVEQMQQDHVFVTQVEAGQRVGVRIPFPVRPQDKIFEWSMEKKAKETP